jgi:hypothetical protein
VSGAPAPGTGINNKLLKYRVLYVNEDALPYPDFLHNMQGIAGVWPGFVYPEDSDGRIIMLEKRSKGQRRWGLEAEYPLKDCNGIMVITDRRRITDRRLDNVSLEERLMLFAEMLPLDPEHH